MRTFSVLNQKGGVGKTTTALNLAHAIALRGHKVAAIDMDPQGHLTTGFGEEIRPQLGMAEVLFGEKSLEEVGIMTRKNLELFPAGTRLSEVEQSVRGFKGGNLLKNELKKIQEKDFIFIDCPPSAAILSMNAIFASTEIIIPVSSDYLALHGLSRLVEILYKIEERLRHKLTKWIVLTRFHGRRRLANEVREKLEKHFPNRVLKTPIREAVALAESPGYGYSIFEHQKNGNGANDYNALAEDLLHGRTR
ncbi:MAG: ParA family protein [Opitutaceae bacterium]|nr:ParA family protein [Opitutaceae bacterium]